MNEAKSILSAIGPLKLFLLFLCVKVGSSGNAYQNDSSSTGKKAHAFLPRISPSPQPFLPLVAPSPLTPMNNSIPKLSGKCLMNFTMAESLIATTAVDCYGPFAPLLANAICCPQVEATLAILVGHSSRLSEALTLNRTSSKHCLSDFKQLLSSRGVTSNISDVCSIRPSLFSESSCPIRDANELENAVDSSMLLKACSKIDPVKECCDQTCQNAIMDAATRVSLKASETLKLNSSSTVNDCKEIVLRWLASKLDSSSAKEVLRGLSNCRANKECPLVLPEANHVAMECGKDIKNSSACCNAMDSYIGHLQKQSLITNLQALNCATNLAMKLKKLNITRDVFRLCHITLKDFTLQVVKQESGCLLQSLPSDATLDKVSGISFTCDLNDNILAPWPSSDASVSLCKKAVKIPALPAAASSQSGLKADGVMAFVVFVSYAMLT